MKSCSICSSEKSRGWYRYNDSYTCRACYRRIKYRETHKRKTPNQRFFSKLDVKGNDECWIWMGSKDNHGYGLFYNNHATHRSHRFAYELAYGKIPDNMSVCHKCDNPSCCNPNHLFLGTQQDNVIDMVKKGRYNSYGKGVFGDRHFNSRIKDFVISQIRELYRTNNYKQKEIAKMFNVSNPYVCQVVNNKIRVNK